MNDSSCSSWTGTSRLLGSVTSECSQVIKDVQLRLEEILADLSMSLRLVAADVSRGVYQTIQPVALQLYVSTEAAVWSVVKDLLGTSQLTFLA